MDEANFEELDSDINSMSEAELLKFIEAHSHDLTTCGFCDWIYDDDQGSIIGNILDRYEYGQLGAPSPSPEVVVAMCKAVDPIWETVETWDSGLAAMGDLTRLTLFPSCTKESYEKLVSGFDWTFFRDQEWTIDDLGDFLRERVSLPNASQKFVKGVVNEFHMNQHEGTAIKSCEECQDLLDELQESS